MSEFDLLRSVLREWKAPEPPAALDARILADFRALAAPSGWKRFWTARISIPVPVLAAAMLLVAIIWLVVLRPAAPAARQPGVVTQLAATGYQPLPDGRALIQDVKQ